MKKEREKTIRLAIVLVALVAVLAIVMPYYADQTQMVRETETEAQVFEEETKEDSDATVLGVILLIGIVAFEVGAFRWILKKEKEGYTFSE